MTEWLNIAQLLSLHWPRSAHSLPIFILTEGSPHPLHPQSHLLPLTVFLSPQSYFITFTALPDTWNKYIYIHTHTYIFKGSLEWTVDVEDVKAGHRFWEQGHGTTWLCHLLTLIPGKLLNLWGRIFLIWDDNIHLIRLNTDWIVAPPKFICWSPNPQCDNIWPSLMMELLP